MMNKRLNENIVEDIRKGILLADQKSLLKQAAKVTGLTNRGILKIGNGKTKNPGYFSLMKIESWLIDNLPEFKEVEQQDQVA